MTNTVQYEINRINGNIAAAYTAASGKGATLPATENSDNLATCVSSIPAGTTPTGTISINSNGTYDVTNYASADVNVPSGLKANYILTSTNGTTYDIGKLTKNNNILDPKAINMTGVFSNLYPLLRSSLRELNLSALREISSANGLENSFNECNYLTNVDFSSLVTVSGNYGMASSFMGCTSITDISFPALTTISGEQGLAEAFRNCTSITDISFPALTTVSGNNSLYALAQGCTSITDISFPALTTVSGNYSLYALAKGCTSITDISFPALTTTSFNNGSSQLTCLLKDTGTTVNHTIHFPSNLQSTIQNLEDYPLFSGTSGYVTLAFDLPATS